MLVFCDEKPIVGGVLDVFKQKYWAMDGCSLCKGPVQWANCAAWQD